MLFAVKITRYANGIPVATQEISQEILLKRNERFMLEGDAEIFDPMKPYQYARRLEDWKRLNSMLDSLQDIYGNPRDS